MTVKRSFPIFLITISVLFAHRAAAQSGVSVSARAAVLMTADGDVLFEKASDERLPMASTTKIMTALAVLENASLDDTVTVTKESAGIEGTSLYMSEGDTSTVRDLLYALMLKSANDAASALACHTSGTEADFVRLMNRKAFTLGLDGTSFSNPHGLPSDGHYTTAYDLARLTAAALENEEFRTVVSTKEYVVTLNGTDKRPVRNHNRLLFTYDGAIGVKTGFTKSSGRCLVTAAEREGVTLIAVTLDDPDDWRDHRAMLDYGFDGVVCRVLFEEGAFHREIGFLGAGSISVTNTERIVKTVRRGEQLSYSVCADRFLSPPVFKGDAAATLVVRCGDSVVGKYPLVSEEDVIIREDRTLLDKLKDLLD